MKTEKYYPSVKIPPPSQENQRFNDGELWEERLQKNKSDYGKLVLCEEMSAYNGWKLVAAVPEYVLTERIGAIGFLCTTLCILSLLAGLGLCLYYWKRREKIVQEYFRLHTRIGTDTTGNSWKDAKFWGTFEGFLSSVNSLWDTFETQSVLIREDLLRKLLYGGYLSAEDLKKDAESTGFFQKKGFYYVISAELEEQASEKPKSFSDDSRKTMEECLSRYLPWDFGTYRVSAFSFAVLIRSNDALEEKAMKTALENMNREIHNQLGLNCYIGISNGTENELELARQCELASRISEYARYQGICTPLSPSDIPSEDDIKEPQYFSIDLELKLLQLLRCGTMKQLELLLEEIHRDYFCPGISQYIYHHALEVLRSCIFRSLPLEDESPEAELLRIRAQNASRDNEIFKILKEVKAYRLQNCTEKDTAASCLSKEKVADYLEKNYGNCNLNISTLAEWLNEPERKIYNDFKSVFGMSFSTYLEQLRIHYAYEFLREGKAVNETAKLVGYSSDYSFRRAFKRIVGITPSAFRNIQKE